MTCFLRNLYAGQEATVKTGHGTTDWFQMEKEYVKAVYCHLLILVICRVHHEKRWADEAQAGIKITGEISVTSDTQMTPPLWQKVKKN